MEKKEKKNAIPLLLVLLGIIGLVLIDSCSPKVVVQKEVVTEYRDRTVHDTAKVEIPYEVEKIVTRDTLSLLENKYAKSEAMVSGGLLHHSLESKPQIIQVPVEVHVTDTLYKESEIVEKEVKVEKPLSWWKSFKIKAFWWLVCGLVLCFLWIFRKPMLKLFGILI